MKNLENLGQILSKSEQKKITGGYFCYYNGCAEDLEQYDTYWVLSVSCDGGAGGNSGTWTGSGQYGGTICGG
jgi:hypothetical protein